MAKLTWQGAGKRRCKQVYLDLASGTSWLCGKPASPGYDYCRQHKTGKAKKEG